MAFSMVERQAALRELGPRYREARKKEKGAILDEVAQMCGYSRAHAARRLCHGIPEKPLKRARKATYGLETLIPLRKIWAVLGDPCGKRLAPFLPELVPVLESFGELHLAADARAKLLSVSAATIDRLLAEERRSYQLKGRSRTKPGSLLKHQIAVRTFAEWDEGRPGFLEIDLVSHDGGLARGDWIQTLDATDVCSGWTETRAVRNRAQVHVFAGLLNIRKSLPFPLLGLDSDNGSEFINDQLSRYCQHEGITFTRSRPYRKNDSYFVEQKNWTVVRQSVGYARYDTEEELALLGEIYGKLRLLTNFFWPQMKLVKKTRQGAKVHRLYDEARTPYQRLIASGFLSEEHRQALTAQYRILNPAALRRELDALQIRLLEITRCKERLRQKEAKAASA
ncbi:MAG: DDE-type integrase/transposase/recombinase [Actinobacteria bacterium]|nr:DDE-type integrase/transposase/recombinase [Actinomycetota bacterium]